jgi:hypothetical protein
MCTSLRIESRGLTCINQLIGPTPIIESVRQLAEQNCYPCLWTPVTYVSGLYTQRERERIRWDQSRKASLTLTLSQRERE